VVNNRLYGTSAGLKIFALDAATGEQLWEFDPSGDNPEERVAGTNRGISYWEKDGDRRLFYCVRNQLLAINANTGQLVKEFGKNGAVDLRADLDREYDENTHIENTSPGVIFQDLIIIGSSVLEAHGSAPGHIRAYNVKSGSLQWIFHTIPHPGEFGYETWPKDYYLTGGGANAWGGLSIDLDRGMVFAPIGAATHDFYGADRVGEGLFANSVLALDAATGAYRWHFQVSHHDVWDYDLPTAPNLVQVNHNGTEMDAVAQLTKQGLIFLLDRETGEPLFEVEELPVPKSRVPGESSWATQPFPVKPPPLVRHDFNLSLVTDISPESRANILEQIEGYTMGSIYTPPSVQGTVQIPGFRGGAEWSGGAFDPESGTIYIGVNDMPNLVQLIENQPPGRLKLSDFGDMQSFGNSVYQSNCAACHGADRKGSINFPSLTSVKDSIPLGVLSELLKTGRGMMPSFKTLPEPERRAILSYLYELATDEAIKIMPLVENPVEKEISTDNTRRYKLKAYKQLRDHLGYPGIKPPWGNLCAVDLNTGEIKWKVPLGEYPELSEMGIPPTGTQLFGGGVVTAGGLVFIGASRDEKFRAFDKDTGEILWEFQLPAGGYATPATYEVEGTQFLTVAAGGGGFQGTKTADYYLTFSLP
jgi:quinoprotein glucose dehydrogenase